MGEVDHAFIQTLEHQPKLDITEAKGVPLIDLSPLNSSDTDADISSLVAEISDAVNTLGYYDTEHTKNVRDWKEVFDLTVKKPTIVPASYESDEKELNHLMNQWPENLPELN
ncbi:Hypothetical predicted protein [Olea europaea subsp. europaea]|uniref:Uncharacterized protein n=1 Tax=Olea europaea subsp. europaea TaxID=158383 RepID=A0A8S0V174_OLEEU|nr:Hypothetical predicted protein [Olea europaea subsp. europaea]